MDYRSSVPTIRILNSKNVEKIGLTAIEALDPLRLVAIFYALYDSVVAAKPSTVLVSPLE